ncbi:MAG: tetratricopeptide repeat protein [Spirochaetota bacterium]
MIQAKTCKLFPYILIVALISAVSPIHANLKDAKRAYSQRRYPKAIRLFQQYAKRNPSSGEPYMYMGYIYEHKKNYPRSTRMFQIAADKRLATKKKLTCYLKVVLYYKYVQRWDYLIHYANRYLKIRYSKNIAKLRSLAYQKKGTSSYRIPPSLAKQKSKSAKKKSKHKKYKKVAKKNSKRKAHNKKKSIVRNKKKKQPSIVKKKIQKKTIPYYESLLHKQTNNEQIRWELALLYLQKKFYNKADTQMQWLVEKFPNNQLYQYKAGITKLRLERYQDAISHLAKAQELSDETTDKTTLYYIHLNKGHAEQKRKQTDAAIKEYQTAYTYKKSHVPRVALAKLYYQNNNFKSSVVMSDIILRKKPKNEDALLYKSLSYLKQEQEDLGYPLLLRFSQRLKEKFIKKEIPKKYNEGLLQLAKYYSNRRKYKIANKYIQLSEPSFRTNRDFLFLKGKVNYYLKSYKNSIQALEKVQDIPASCYLIAKSYSQLNQPEKLTEFLNKAGKLDRNYWIKAQFDLDFEKNFLEPSFISFLENLGKNTALSKAKLAKKETSSNPVKKEKATVQPKKVEEPNKKTLEKKVQEKRE